MTSPRLVAAIERLALAVEHRERAAVERIPIPAIALQPQASDRQRLNLTPNSSIPIQIDANVYDLSDGRRYLRLVLLDGYGSIFWRVELQASTLDEVRAAGLFA